MLANTKRLKKGGTGVWEGWLENRVLAGLTGCSTLLGNRFGEGGKGRGGGWADGMTRGRRGAITEEKARKSTTSNRYRMPTIWAKAHSELAVSHPNKS